MKILFVTYDFPFPLNSGGKNRAYHLIKYAKKAPGISIDLLSFARGEFNNEGVGELKKIGVNDVKIYKRKNIKSLSTLVKNLTSRNSIFKTLYYEKNFLILIKEMIRKNKIDIVHFESSYTGYYIESLKQSNVKTVLGTENIEYLLYDKLKKETKNIFKKPIIAYHVKRLKAEEEKMMKAADLCLAVTFEEAMIIKSITNKSTKVIENAVETKNLPFSPNRKINYNILFVGNFLYAPNVEAVKFFESEVMPILDDRINLTIIGKNAFRVAHKNSRTTTKEFVDNIINEYYRADALIFPVKIGGGTNFKILEAMALGTPVIAFPERLMGLKGKSGEHFLGVNSAEEFKESIEKIMKDKKFALEIAENARRLIEENYSWDIVGKKLSKAWRELYERKN